MTRSNDPPFPLSPDGAPRPTPDVIAGRRDPFAEAAAKSKRKRPALRKIAKVSGFIAGGFAVLVIALSVIANWGDERSLLEMHDHSVTEREIPVDGRSNAKDGVATVTYEPVEGDVESTDSVGRSVMADGHIRGDSWRINHWTRGWRSSVGVLNSEWEQDLSDQTELKRWVYLTENRARLDALDEVETRPLKLAGASGYSMTSTDRKGRFKLDVWFPHGHRTVSFHCLIAPSNPQAMINRCYDMFESLKLKKASR